MSIIQKPRGTQDFLPEATRIWQYVESTLRNAAKYYNYHEIRTPMFESYDLFERGVGDTTDIVSKEMYDFYDKGDRHIALRAEGTAPVIRSYIENKLFGQPDLQKLYYIMPNFRYERAKAGRFRQHHQFGVEALGAANPALDAEVISFAYQIYQQFGLRNIEILLNSIGNTASRLAYRQALQDHFRPVLSELCADCQVRFDKNPLRILDCKADHTHPSMNTAPSIADYYDEASKQYFEQVCAYLDALEVPYTLDDRLVRGLDYYQHTVFEIVLNSTSEKGLNVSLAGGGRYDGLTEMLGGPQTSGIGFGMGLERLILSLESENVVIPLKDTLDVFVMPMDSSANIAAVTLLQQLRENNLQADMDYQSRGLKTQFKAAERANAKFAVIIGESELSSGKFEVKDLRNRSQEAVASDEIASYIYERTEEI
ncbi:histidine--tRNA ligase [Culicoidibacter larvae]|uniref:Histidine--tRNA ligase n=1 Tax=Culicoidibacter larvae TaxID=2579976 RepID=A0A5R8QDJ1_9FIRM|nr:histidine--tRNA ligase [Culicoidibacter larvae]TLG74336.1 histidine--tRNA ligase [Culicoidibacter larvae]